MSGGQPKREREIEDLVPAVSITALLMQRDAIVERLRGAAALLREVEELAERAFPQARHAYASPRLEEQHLHCAFPDGLDRVVKAVDATGWDHLMSVSGMRTFMDAATRKKWDTSVGEMSVPSLTAENIRETFKGLYSERGAMFEDGVISVFRALSWDYKTNSPCRFGKRIIIPYLVDTWGSGKSRYTTGVRYETCHKLDDLLRVMSVLDGKPEPDSRRGASVLLREAEWPKSGAFEFTGLLSVKGYKNGNGHVTFLRADLVDKMNCILAKHYEKVLPPKES